VGNPSPHPFHPATRQQQRGVLLPVLGAVVIGICGLVVLGLVGARVGVVGVLVGAVAALVPVAAVVGAFLWIDRWEPEPPRLLLAAFGWGACVATLSSLIINSTASVVADTILGEGSGDIVSAVVSAPLVEEGMKAVFLFLLVWLRRREFDGVVDGVVYAGLTAAGFAFTENILYFGRAFADAGLAAGADGGVLTVFILRGLLSPFAHPLFTAATGVALGIAVTTRSRTVRVVAPIGGYLGSVLLHALWNGSATLAGGTGFLVVYGLIMMPLFAGAIVLVVWQRRREQRVVAAELPAFTQAGWIAPSEVALLASLAGRRGWRAAVRRQTGAEAARAVAAYQATVTELAFLRSRMVRGIAGPSADQWHDELVAALIAARANAVARPQALRAAHTRPPPGWQPPPVTPPAASSPAAARPPTATDGHHRHVTAWPLPTGPHPPVGPRPEPPSGSRYPTQ
jgi:protease PrsW